MFMAGILVSCTSGARVADEPTASVIPSVIITADDLAGDWGLASYRDEADRPRTEKEARAACSNPYSIARGQRGGVMMHLADQTQPLELYLKPDQNGQIFLGPAGDPAHPKDRRIVSFADGVLVAQWVDPGTAERMGTMVFVRCAA
jgi:hypothetical protein